MSCYGGGDEGLAPSSTFLDDGAEEFWMALGEILLLSRISDYIMGLAVSELLSIGRKIFASDRHFVALIHRERHVQRRRWQQLQDS